MLIAAAIVTFVIAGAMPARSLQGAMIRAMLAAYRRTLQKTLEMARSMNQVVESRAVPWLETPDQAVVWGVALGLHEEVERVFDRTLDDLRAGSATTVDVRAPLVRRVGLRWLESTAAAGSAAWRPGCSLARRSRTSAG